MKIKVIGAGITKFGELWNQSLTEIALEAAHEAIKRSGLKGKDIDAIYVGNMLASHLDGQDHLGALIAEQLGLHIPAFKVEAACASGGLAMHLAVQALKSGDYKNVLVIGAEKMTDASAAEVSTALMGAGSEEERRVGLTIPGLYALLAKSHLQRYGTKLEQLAAVAVKNHYHASLNNKAQFPFPVTLEKVLSSSMVAEPLTLLDCSPITDGAAAVVLSNDPTIPGVTVLASSVATDTLGISQRKSLTSLAATKIAAEKAFDQAKILPKDISFAEVHDCFTIAEILAMEDIGFCKAGEGGKYIESGITTLGNTMPVNTSGGLKACGHPVGATGIKQIVEVFLQLTNQAGKRQVKNSRVGLTHNVGGSGATVVVHILQK